MTAVDAAPGRDVPGDDVRELAGAAGIPGRVSIAERALRAVFAAVAAEHLGVRPRDVKATVADERGRLAVAVTAPARRSESGSLAESGAAARDAVRVDGGRIAGVEVSSVSVRIIGVAAADRSTARRSTGQGRRAR
ncbi:hypothetical protein [Schumannella soli]|uniref:Asp23/Gls24 family envelope stress response protein n=1 Tax=Schumannella soli TaxID=2590779 RepID=A0A506XXF4_9MICO|nr:hypothetical protein [Schumannella soli]TPW77441.1 hypothetical protein FJ657_01790 [Schumannella soli]